ncbi:PREDICTED: bestrophin-4 [Drosophila arizonae]|uniref:Bestrophin homolog n=1 Tax=Drosophila arizonae TaxID=7263 RepID=A0ABM1PA31_DROAR|nr:PREDICTED: bestrophin-4 [Drosophila arizonae]
MTVTYTADVSSRRFISNFLRVLFRWRGSIYKLMWVDLLVFVCIYVLLAFIYRVCLNSTLRKGFEYAVMYCNSQLNLIPLSFVMGYFVAIVMTRWWQQYTTIPWPDSIATLISCSVHGFDDRARAMRRTIMRYVCLCQTIVFTMISPSVKKRFPSYNQIIEAGLLQENEKQIIETLDLAFPHYPKHWMPIVWAASIVMRARRENKIRDDYAVKTIIDELNRFRGLCGFLLYYDWVSVPLVYTQVVTLATYTFFLCSVIGSQWIDNPQSPTANNLVVKYFPILSILRFFFYMGWLKVAESLINPFGEDDDDFEVNWMIDRNLTVSYLIVDEMHQEHPELLKDQYWDEVFPNELPYIDESKRTAPPVHSTAKLIPSLDNKLGFYMPQSSHSLLSQNTSSQMDMTTSLQRLREILKRQNESEDKQSSTSMNLEELIEQRHREKRERLRHRFLNMNKPSSTGRGYVVTVLRPPTPRTSQRSLIEEENEAEEEQGEEEQTKEPDSDAANKKPDKYE